MLGLSTQPTALWLWFVDGIRPSVWDIVGASIALTGMVIIMFAPKNA
ncbi:MAG: hypothetical protein ACXW0T_09345 [Methylobacter sp.]